MNDFMKNVQKFLTIYFNGLQDFYKNWELVDKPGSVVYSHLSWVIVTNNLISSNHVIILGSITNLPCSKRGLLMPALLPQQR